MNYSIENLDVYRKSVSASADICRSSRTAEERGASLLAQQLQMRALSVVTHLADGLGFWEGDHKVRHFTASKEAVLEALPLLEVMAGLGLVAAEDQMRLSAELRDLAKMISGLLRGTRQREKSAENPSGEGGELRERAGTRH